MIVIIIRDIRGVILDLVIFSLMLAMLLSPSGYDGLKFAAVLTSHP